MYTVKYFSLLLLSFPLILAFSQALTHFWVILIALYSLFHILLKKETIIFKNRYFLFFILFCLYLLSVSVLSSKPTLSLEVSLFYFRYFLFSTGVYLLLINNKDLINKLFLILSFILIFVSLDGIIQFIFKYNLFGYPKFEPDRVSGIFNDELILGSFITRLFPIFLFLYYFCVDKKNNYFETGLIFCISIFLIGTIFSGDRTAVLFFILTIFILFLADKNFRYKLFVILLSLFILLIIISYFDESLYYRYIHRTLINDFQIYEGIKNFKFFSDTHEQHLFTSFEIFKENILFGSGPKLFRIECLNYKDLYFHGCSTHPHNTYMQLLAEIGIIGTTPIFILFLYFSYKIIRQIYLINLSTNFSLENNLSIFLYTFIIITLLPIIPSANFFSSYLNSIFYFQIGILVYYYKIK